MVGKELTFDDAVSYSGQRNKWIVTLVNVMAVTGFVPLSPESPNQCINQLSYLRTPRGLELDISKCIILVVSSCAIYFW